MPLWRVSYARIMPALATMMASGGALDCMHETRCAMTLSSPADTRVK